MSTIENDELDKKDTAFKRANLSNRLYRLFEMVEKDLEEREVKTSFFEFSDYIVDHLPMGLCDKFVDSKTPLKYKLSRLADDPKMEKEIAKLIEKYSSSK